MATVKLPVVELPEGSLEDKVLYLTDLIQQYKKNLEYFLNNLDDDNILNIDSAIIRNLKAVDIEAQNVLITEGGTARVVLNETTIAMQKWEGGQWVNKVYFDSDAGKYIFDGTLTATTLEAINATVVYMVTQSFTAEKGYIAELTVDSLETSTKLQNYLASDTSDVNYIKIQDQNFDFITAHYEGGGTTQATDRKGHPLYWTDNTKTLTTTDVTPYPARMYVYDELTKLHFGFDESNPKIPFMQFGAGDGVLPLSSKAFIKKTQTGVIIEYYKSNTAEKISLELCDTGILFNGQPLRATFA